MTPGFCNATDAGHDASATYFFSFVYFRQRFHVLMTAYTAGVYQYLASIGDSNFFLGLQIMSLMLNLLRRNQELPIGIRRTAHGVRCNVAPVRGVGSSSRTSKTPPAVSTLYPAHHRATKALANVASPK